MEMLETTFINVQYLVCQVALAFALIVMHGFVKAHFPHQSGLGAVVHLGTVLLGSGRDRQRVQDRCILLATQRSQVGSNGSRAASLQRSPNVNVASQLEAASTQLQLWILMSSFMVKLCSLTVIEACP